MESETESTTMPAPSTPTPETTTTTATVSFKPGDHVWFDADQLTLLPGIVTDYSDTTELVTIESTAVDGTNQIFNVQNTESNVKHRTDFCHSIVPATTNNDDSSTQTATLTNGQNETTTSSQNNTATTIDDMIHLNDLHQSALFWNLKKRYERNKIYTFIGDILISLNPYKMFEIYGLNVVKKYQNQALRASATRTTATQSPHLFAIGNLAYSKMQKDNENQSILIMGESGSGKTENTKLLLQYLAAINKSPSNIITEQILESIPLLESFGNAKTTRNNNASRYCKFVEIFFNNGVINGARTIEFLHEKSRIVSHNREERNYHIFYELLAGLSDTEKEKYGLQSADKYFYLNQGNCYEIDGKDDSEDFRFLIGAMQVLGFTSEEQDIIFRILASILHLGNVYFHRKQFRNGQEGVEIGSDAEIRWVSHLLQIPIEDIYKLVTVRTTETGRNERILTPLNIDQALDMRDAISKVLYVSLFSWLVQRINHIVYRNSRKPKIAILDMFGFENLKENNFEQLCVNYANELMYSHFIQCFFRLEQAEYAKEKIEYRAVDFPDNQPILNLISKKPIGILPLLEDESNFPKASDSSFLEKCHYNHALNEIYSRARMTAAEFGIKHFEGQVWYSVEGFLEKNRNILKADVVDMLLTCKMPIMNKIFHYGRESADTAHRQVNRIDGRFITIKPRTPTVSARFQESLTILFDSVSETNPWFIRCIRPNNDREPMKFDDRIVFDQLNSSALLETIMVARNGFRVRMKYSKFVARYHNLLNTSQLPRGTSSKEVTRLILEKKISLSEATNGGYRFGFSKIFLKDTVESALEKERFDIMTKAAVTLQSYVRAYLARRRYRSIRRGVVCIQTSYRGYRERQKYQSLKRGVVLLQATYRMRKQQQAYEKIKTLKRKREAERFVATENSNGNSGPSSGSYANQNQNGHKSSNGGGYGTLDRNSLSSVPGLDRLEMPYDLTSLLNEMDKWKCIHSFGDIVKMSKPVLPLKNRNTQSSLPYDIDQYSFAKFTNIYFRSHIWSMKREPIKAPFLQKNSDEDFQESLSIFKLILRFMNDNNLSGKKEKLLADYIAQKGIANIGLRDEIFCQLCNQTWKNENPESNDRGWILMTHCLGSFTPSPLLYKYLLKYISDYSPNVLRPILQRLLLTGDRTEPYNARAYPGSLLEWKANLKKCGMSTEIEFSNGDTKLAQIEQWTTGEQLTSQLLQSAGFNQNAYGWSVDFEEDTDQYSINGDQYIMDMICQMELCPSFPASKNYYIGCSGNRNRGNGKSSLLNPYHNPEMLNKFNVDGIVNQRLENNGNNKSDRNRFMKSSLGNIQQELNQKLRRSMSGEMLTRLNSNDNEDVRQDNNGEDELGKSPLGGLAVTSRLNERYLLKSGQSAQSLINSRPSPPQQTPEELSSGRLAEEEDVDEDDDDDLAPLEQDEPSLKLSEKSRLNQRYISNSNNKLTSENHHHLNKKSNNKSNDNGRSNRKNLYTRKNDKQQQSAKLLNQRSISMQELGLASSSLNVRYFSRDKLNKAASLTGGSDNDSDSLNKVQSLMNFGEQDGGGSSSAANSDNEDNPSHPHHSHHSHSHHSHLHHGPQHHHSHHHHNNNQNKANFSRQLHKNMSGRPLPAEPIGSDGNGVSGVAGESSQNYRPSGHRTKSHMIRPSSHSSSTSSSFESDSSSCINDNDSPMDDGHNSSKDPNGANGLRYRKYSSNNGGNKNGHMSKSQPYLNNNSRGGGGGAFAGRHKDAELFAPKGSAMSDTSEAPSLASHVRNIRIPSHTSELDQYLDDLFSPVLDANLDDAMSDARSLAQSIKGGVNEVEPNPSPRIQSNLDPNQSLSNSNLQLQLSGLSGSMVDQNVLQQQVMQQQMYQMQQRAFLASSLQQNLEIQKQLLQQNQQLQQLLAQAVTPGAAPAPGTPTSSSFSMPSQVAASASLFQNQSDHNHNHQKIPPTPAPKSNNLPKIDIIKSRASSHSSSNSNSSGGAINGNRSIPIPPPPPPPPPMSPGTDVFGRVKTIRIGKWRWPPPSEETAAAAAAAAADGATAADTASNNTSATVVVPTASNNFIEFKRMKQIEKQQDKMAAAMSNSTDSSENDFKQFSNSNGNESSSNGEEDNKTPYSDQGVANNNNKKSSSESTSSSSNRSSSSANTASQHKDVIRKFSDNNVPGSIGKLRISTEMRAKLEQLTIDQSVRSRRDGKERGVVQSQSMDDLANMGSVKKLSEQRKALLERQLMGSLRNSATFMETTSTPNIKQTVDTAAARHSGHHSGNHNHQSSHHHHHKKLSKENSANSNYEQSSVVSSPAGTTTTTAASNVNSSSSAHHNHNHVKKFIKNHQQQLMSKSGSREFRERREELGPFNRLSSSTSHVNHYSPSLDNNNIGRPLYTPDRYFQGSDMHDHPPLQQSQRHHSASATVLATYDADSHSGLESVNGNDRHSSFSGHYFHHHGGFQNGKPMNKRMNIPPPPPPIDGVDYDDNFDYDPNPMMMMPTTTTTNGFDPNKRNRLSSNNRHPHSRSQDRLSFEQLDFEECDSDFLRTPQSIHRGGNKHSHLDTEDKLAAQIPVKTKLFQKNETNFYAYSKPKFKLQMRKEVFSPAETVDNPIMLDLIFWQIVSDAYADNCIRLNSLESEQLQKQLKSEGIPAYNPSLYQAKSAFKRSLLECAKEFSLYFSRLYVVSGGKSLNDVDYLAVSHAGVNLVKRDRATSAGGGDCLNVIEKFSFDEISEILIPNNCTIQILLTGSDWITLYSNKALQIRNLIEKFIVEHQQTSVDYVRAIKDYSSQEQSVLSFKKDNIIRVVKNKNLHLAKGWLFGVLEFGESGLFQTSYVVPLTEKQIQTYQRQMEEEDSIRNHNHHQQQQLPAHPQLQSASLSNGFHSNGTNGKIIGDNNNNHHPGPHHNSINGNHTMIGLLENGNGLHQSQEFNSLWIEQSRAEISDDSMMTMLKNGENHSGSANQLQSPLLHQPGSMIEPGNIVGSLSNDGNFSLLQFALFNFRESLSKYDLRGHLKDNSIRGSIKMIENLKSKRKSKGKGDTNDWTWSEFANLVKYQQSPIQASLLMLPSELNKVSIECFTAIMRYMGDTPMAKNQNEVDCVYTILLNCHKYSSMRDEIYCQLMKQTTSNKSIKGDSCQRGWRLFSIVASYFDCSEPLRPYLFKYLETAAYDKRRAFHVTASITLKNLKKTFKYGGRKNVPSIEEIAAISAGRTSKRQMYRLPGGTERVLNTTCTTVVNDIIEEICLMLNVNNSLEMEEFSLYCIIEGDPFTMPLNRDEYILDVTTELLKNSQLFYLIFCRSVWYYPLRLDSHLYIEVVFNQVAPDYLEGLLIIIAHEILPDDTVQQIALIASLLHRAAEMEQMPTKDEIKYLLPKPVLAMRTIKPPQWVEMVQNNWNDMSALSTIEAKAQCLDILQKWPLFGSCFFAVKRIQNESHTQAEHILALNKDGVHFLEMTSHEKVWKHPFSEVISTRKVRSEDGTLYLDMKCGNLMVQKITRIQTDQAHEISRLIRQYIEIEQHLKNGRTSQNEDKSMSSTDSQHH